MIEVDCSLFGFFVPDDMSFHIDLSADTLDGEYMMPLKYELDSQGASWSTYCGFATEMTFLESNRPTFCQISSEELTEERGI